MQYRVEDLVSVAKRDNNTIRPYLYVNPKQGKHIPSDPEDVFSICRSLANIVNDMYPTDKLYVIGFAETATGIASGVCHFLRNVVYYQNTTRELSEAQNYLYFTESHSHATDQTLRSAGIKERINNVDRIVVVDDEITTGNTVLKLIQALGREFNASNIKYSIVSVLNSMPNKRIDELKLAGIDCLFLSNIPYEYKKESIQDIELDKKNNTVIVSNDKYSIDESEYYGSVNARIISSFKDYDEGIYTIINCIAEELNNNHFGSILVLGTEEFMYPTLCLGDLLIKKNLADDVKIHATTRSPIIASEAEGYPLFHRYQIRSLYDDSRKTYVYNLKKYEKVIILTDARNNTNGISDLITALKSVGNNDISLIRWCYAA